MDYIIAAFELCLVPPSLKDKKTWAVKREEVAATGIATCCITVRYAGLTVADRKTLQRVTRTTRNVMGCPQIPLEEIAETRC